MTPPMTNDLIEQLLSDAESFTGDFNSVALPGPLANKRADRLRQAAAHIEAQAERVRELEGARAELMRRLAWSCHDWADYDDEQAARQARKDKENG